MKKCPKCGTENLDKAQFCAKCGEDIKNVEPQTIVYVNGENKTKPSILTWLLPLIVSIVLFILTFIHFVFFWISFNVYRIIGVFEIGIILFPMLFAYIDIVRNKSKISVLSLSISTLSFVLFLVEFITILCVQGRY